MWSVALRFVAMVSTPEIRRAPAGLPGMYVVIGFGDRGVVIVFGDSVNEHEMPME
jgi:hypothetical protein